jgi:peptide/nickel transport system permease protein
MIATYAARRILATIPVLFLVALVTFSIIHLIPGDPARMMLGDHATPEQIERVREQLGLNDPLPQQFASWLGGVVRGDLGESPFMPQSINEVIVDRARVSFTLAILAQTLAVILGIAVGMFAALRRGTAWDSLTSSAAVAGIAVPNFVFAIVLVAVFAVSLGWLPATGFVAPWDDFWGGMRSLALPATALGIKNAALIARMMRGSMVEVLQSDYMNAVRVKGLSRMRELVVHALPNALGPTIMVIGVGFGSLVSGMVVIEVVFSIPGLGRLAINGVQNRDIPLLQGVMLAVTTLYIVVTLIADIAQAWVNPRVKLE